MLGYDSQPNALPLAMKEKCFEGSKAMNYVVKLLLVRKGLQFVLENGTVLSIS